MVRSLKRAIRPLAWVVMLTLTVVVSTECLIGAAMTEAQKACCAAMDHNCDSAGIEQDCCPSESSNLTGFVAASPASLLLTAPPVAVALPAAARVLPTSVCAPAFDWVVPKSSSRPTYLFVSVFRI